MQHLLMKTTSHQFPHQLGSSQMQHHGDLIAVGYTEVAIPAHVNPPRRFLNSLLPLAGIMTFKQRLATNITLQHLGLL